MPDIKKDKIKERLKKIFGFFLNPHLLICVLIAWMITNGWSYIAMCLGTYFGINWLIAVSGAYLSFLWFPFTPEKLITVIIAIKLLKTLFPNDRKTLAVLKNLKKSIADKREKRRNKPSEKD